MPPTFAAARKITCGRVIIAAGTVEIGRHYADEVAAMLAAIGCAQSFIYDNIAIAAHVIQVADWNGAEKLMFLCSSCISPRSWQRSRCAKIPC
ncbi:hypothetical protein [Bradyrhizobium sp. F1.13.3]|uniref:hypothetical protein n=1 Tax=Bradyrhizobium sp. F1.13.3 TaxID=3156351 RepID=UPI0033953901